MKSCKKIMLYLIIFVFQLTFSSAQEMNVRDSKKSIDKVIFVGGAGFNKTFIKYVAELTNKPDPKICLTRPEKSLHFLVKSPDSNLHFLVSPEIALHLITG